MESELEEVISLAKFSREPGSYIKSLSQGDRLRLIVDLGGGRCVMLEKGKTAVEVVNLSSMARLAQIEGDDLNRKALDFYTGRAPALSKEEADRLSIDEFLHYTEVSRAKRRVDRITGIVRDVPRALDPIEYRLRKSILSNA